MIRKSSIIFLLILMSLTLTITPLFAATNSGGHGHSSEQTPSSEPEQKPPTMEVHQGTANANTATNEHSNMDNSEMRMEESTGSEGVNWLIIGGFLGINAIVITIAGVLKLLNNKYPISIAKE